MNSALTTMAQALHERLGRYLSRRDRGNRDGHSAFGHHVPDRPCRHDREEALTEVLAGLGQRDPVEQLLMLEAFLSSEGHFTPREFSDLLKGRGQDIDSEKAAGILELFTALGFAEKHLAEDGRALYEHKHPGLHHDHLVCSGCGRTAEFHRPDVEGMIEKIACDEHYSHLKHKLVIYGLCPQCRLRRREGLPLSETAAGEEVAVLSFEGPEDVKQRLADLGIRRGSRLKILGEQGGSVIVLSRGCRLALGSEMSSDLLVRAARQDHCPRPDIPMAGRGGR